MSQSNVVPTLKIELTVEEANALLALMDSGVKTVGLAAARVGAVVQQKLEAAAQAAKVPTSPVSPPTPTPLPVKASRKSSRAAANANGAA